MKEKSNIHDSGMFYTMMQIGNQTYISLPCQGKPSPAVLFESVTCFGTSLHFQMYYQYLMQFVGSYEMKKKYTDINIWPTNLKESTSMGKHSEKTNFLGQPPNLNTSPLPKLFNPPWRPAFRLGLGSVLNFKYHLCYYCYYPHFVHISPSTDGLYGSGQVNENYMVVDSSLHYDMSQFI